MEFLVPLALGLILGLIVGAVAGILLGRRGATPTGDDPAVVAARHEAALAQRRAEEAAVRAELTAELAGLTATADGLREQVTQAQQAHREFVERAQAEQRAREERERADSKVLQALTPVQETLRTMQAKVTDLETQRSQQHGQLTQQLKSATESEERLRATAESLASALRSNSVRGVWGETQLRNVVQAAGLIERVDFDSATGTDG